MKRIVEPELLDELPQTDPRAIHSRRDLGRINFLMGNVGIVERVLRTHFPEAPKRIAELGSGDGTFMLELAQKFPCWENLEVIFVDRQNLVSPETKEEFHQLGWRVKVVSADVFDWLSVCEPADCLVANLFLHHFEDEKLSELLRLAARKTGMFIACEPRRSSAGILGTKFLGLIGCNDVTSHDAAVSVRAGFCAGEISKLWPQNETWKVVEGNAGLFSHTFVAARL